MSNPRVAIVGATGAVGEQFMVTLKKRNFPMSELVLMASARSAGMKLEYDGKELEVVEANPEAMVRVAL